MRRRGWVALGWLAIVAIALWLSSGLDEALRGSGTARSSESKRVEAAIARDFPSPYSQFVVVAVGHPGTSVSADLDRLRACVGALPCVTCILPLDGTRRDRGAFLVGLRATTLTETEALVPTIREAIARDLPRDPSRELAVTGQAAFDVDMVAFGNQAATTAERRVIPLMIVALFVAFGALGAALLPLVAGSAAIVASMGALTLLAHHFTLSVFAANVITMLGLGLGVDYALFVVARAREERASHAEPAEAVKAATRHALPAIAVSAATVMIGLAALATIPAEDTFAMGIGGVLVAVASGLAAVTLLPALAALLGNALDWPRGLSRRMEEASRRDRWERFARSLLRRPVLVLVASLAILAALAAPMRHLALGDPEITAMPERIEAVHGYRLLRELGAAGDMLPIQLLVEAPRGEPLLTPPRIRGLSRMATELRRDPHVERVIALVDPDRGAARLGAGVALLGEAAVRRALPEDARALISRDGKATVLYVIVKSDTSYQEGRAFGKSLHGRDWSGLAGFEGTRVSMGGVLAFSNELIGAIDRSTVPVVIMVVAATLVMLFGLTRSYLIPLKAVLANLATVAGALGGTCGLLQSDWGSRLLGLHAPVATLSAGIPLITFCVLFGLSMDYEVFLIARIQEAHRQGLDDPEAIARGIGASGPVITSGAVLMAIVFMGFALTEFIPLKVLGLSLTLGVTLDATIVRFALVPSLMTLAGRWNWLPGDRPCPRSASEINLTAEKNPAS